MGYMIEGGGSKTMDKSKSWLEHHPEATKTLLNLLTDVIVEYLEMQVKAGAQLLQVFESSAEHLSKDQFLTVALPHLRDIRQKLLANLERQKIDPVPMVRINYILKITVFTLVLFQTLFAKGGGHSLKEQSELGYEVIGIDWTVNPLEARAAVGPNVTLQGNLDPQDLYKSPVCV